MDDNELKRLRLLIRDVTWSLERIRVVVENPDATSKTGVPLRQPTLRLIDGLLAGLNASTALTEEA